MKALKTVSIIIGIIILAAGCASVETSEEWAQLKSDVQERTGREILWEQSQKEVAVIQQ
ncbi:MAG: hypothetical protein JRG79_19050, partial [Deltaproteobacteria bacterium]|nr:hypothetical protein [Deltaproteobacteria bacterium]